MSHLLLVLAAVVAQHVDDQHAAARLQRAGRFAQHGERLGDVVKDQTRDRSVELGVVDGEPLEIAVAHVDTVEACQALARRLEHRPRAVDGDDLADERRHGFADLAGSTAEIAEHPAVLEQAGEGFEVEALAEGIVTQTIPVAGRGVEERLRAALPLRQDRSEALVVVGCGAALRRLLAQ